MGGGGYIPSSTYGGVKNVEELESIAKKELQKGQPETRKKIFISFASENLDLANLFRGQAKNENSKIDFIDYSLKAPFDSENADYIKRGIRERITQSSVTVVLVSDTTYQSKWVDWEIRESLKMGKKVIAVKVGDKPITRLPPALQENNINPMPWEQAKIDNAIND